MYAAWQRSGGRRALDPCARVACSGATFSNGVSTPWRLAISRVAMSTSLKNGARLVVRLLQRQRLVEHKPTRARNMVHRAPLLAARAQFKLEYDVASCRGNIQHIKPCINRHRMHVASAQSFLPAHGEVCRANDQCDDRHILASRPSPMMK